MDAWREWNAFTGGGGKASALSDAPSKALPASGGNARGMGAGGERAIDASVPWALLAHAFGMQPHGDE